MMPRMHPSAVLSSGFLLLSTGLSSCDIKQFIGTEIFPIFIEIVRIAQSQLF